MQTHHPLALADAHRLEAFALLGQPRLLSRDADVWLDAGGTPWIARRGGGGGGGGGPRHWRQQMLAVLRGLTWVHVADREDEGPPALGPGTALLYHAGDLRGEEGDGCEQDCPGRGRPRHHHVIVNL